MKSKNIIYLLCVLLFFSCESDNQNIKLGVLFPMTGDAGSYGEKGNKAVELGVKQINDAGGINGRYLEVILEDSKAEPKTGVNAAQKLVEIDKVPAIVGDIVSSVTLPVAPICEKSKTVLIAPTSSAPAITDAGGYIYRVWPSDLAEGKAAGIFVKERGYKKAIIMHINNDYGNSIASIFSENFKNDQNEIVLIDSYDKDQTDFRVLINKSKSLQPDVVYVAGYYADVARIVKQSKEMGFNTQFIGVTAIEDEEFLRIAGDAAEGVVYPIASGFDINSTDPYTQDFVNAFRTMYGYDPGWVEAHCYDAFMIVVESLKNIDGEISGETIKNYIDKTQNFTGVTGDIVFDKNGDVIKPVRFKIIKNGAFVNLEN